MTLTESRFAGITSRVTQARDRFESVLSNIPSPNSLCAGHLYLYGKDKSSYSHYLWFGITILTHLNGHWEDYFLFKQMKPRHIKRLSASSAHFQAISRFCVHWIHEPLNISLYGLLFVSFLAPFSHFLSFNWDSINDDKNLGGKTEWY